MAVAEERWVGWVGGYLIEGRISYHKQIIMYVSNAQMMMMPGANERPYDLKILYTCSFLLLADLGAIFQFILHSVQVFVLHCCPSVQLFSVRHFASSTPSHIC